MKRFAMVVATWCLCFAASSPAFGWNYAGHMIVAKIAWLKLSPEEREAVTKILKRHPHYASHLAAGRPDGVDVDEWAFLRAATWPDQIRPPRGFPLGEVAAHPVHKFHHAAWHYVDYPYTAHEKIGEKLPAPLPAKTDILRQLPLSVAVVNDASSDDPGREAGVDKAANQAVRLCWLLHLVGDLHQPLHTTALVDERAFPAGYHDDQGGNLSAIRAEPKGAPLRLHSYWDGLLGSDSRFETVSSIAQELLDSPDLAPDHLRELEHTTIAAWTRESYEHCVKTVYLDGNLPTVSFNEVDARRVAASDVPLLPEAAARDARKLARRRVLLAGLRIAKLLESVAP